MSSEPIRIYLKEYPFMFYEEIDDMFCTWNSESVQTQIAEILLLAQTAASQNQSTITYTGQICHIMQKGLNALGFYHFALQTTNAEKPCYNIDFDAKKLSEEHAHIVAQFHVFRQNLKYGMQVLKFLDDSNQAMVELYENSLAKKFADVLDFSVHLAGSRSVGLAYPQSDLEVAIVFQDKTPKATQKEQMEKAKTILQQITSENVLDLHTKAGLHLLVAKNTHLGIWKLEVTGRTKSEHKAIQSNMHNRVRHMTSFEKEQYILKAQKLFIENDTQGQLEHKKWMKILKEK